MRNIVILDIETTGNDYLLDEICQLSYIVLDKDLNIIKNKNFFFMVDYIQYKSNKKKLNIEELKKLSDNKTFKDRYEEIFNDLNDNLIVCHKCEHDISFLKTEFIRIDNKNNFIYEEFCTMKHYTNILKIPSENYGYKYPKLIEIMPYLNIKRGDIYNKTKEIFDIYDDELNFHDSRVDVVATYLVAIKTDDLVDMYNRDINKLEDIKVNINENIYSKSDNNKIVNVLLEETNQINENKNVFSYKQKNSIFRDLLSFKGSISRKKFGVYIFTNILIYILLMLVMRKIYISTDMYEDTFELLILLLNIAKSYIIVSLTIKRLRDLSKPLWLALLLIIPIVNLIFIIELCFLKGNDKKLKNVCKLKNKGTNKIKISKPIYILIGSIMVPVIVLLALWIWSNLDNANETEAIEIVRFTLHHNSETDTIDTYINEKVEEIDPYYIDGWYANKVEDNIYLVSFDFDRYDDNYTNGYNSFPYEVNLDTQEVTEISSDEIIKKYEDLGYFDDESYINEFKIDMN